MFGGGTRQNSMILAVPWRLILWQVRPIQLSGEALLCGCCFLGCQKHSAEIVAKMVEGGLNKFLSDNTLLGQPFVKDDKQSVEKMLASRKSKLLGFRFFVVGEGIEKKTSDFAAEVMSMVKN